MKLFVLVCSVLHIVSSRPLEDNTTTPKPEEKAEKYANVVKYDVTNDGLGKYEYNFETSNGITRYESGKIEKDDASQNEVLKVTGGYSYVAPDGTLFQITYTADENGFQPKITKLDKDIFMKEGGLNFDTEENIGSHVAGSLIGGGLGR